MWRGEESLREDIRENLDVELDQRRSMEFGEQFSDAYPVDGARPRDYLQRLVPVGNTQLLLTGIRFHYFLEFPFVDIVASTEPLEDQASMRRAIDALRHEYDAFEPECVRILCPADRSPPRPEDLEVSADQYIVIGSIDRLTERRMPRHDESVRLVAVDDIEEAVEFVQTAYEEFFARQPMFEDRIVPADNERLSRARQTGALYYIEVNGSRAGLLATRDKLGPLVRGQTVVEEILTSQYRGRGIAPVAQRRLIDRLAESHPGALVRGTIDAENTPSRATAHRVGRRTVATWYWYRW